MTALCANVCIALILVVGVIFLRNIFRRSWDVLSWRNLFLLGLAHFYFLSAYFTATGNYTASYHFGSDEAYFLLTLLMPVYLFVFLASAHFAFARPRLTRVVPRADFPITTPGLLAAIGALMGLAVVAALVPVFGFLTLIAAQIRGQLACVAMGLATYFLIARKFNPVSWTVFLFTFGAAVIVGTVGLSGRRFMLGVVLMLPWIWYFTIWRYRSGMANFARFAAAAVIGFMSIVIYSPLRGEDIGKMGEGATFERRAQQLTELVTNPRIDTSVIKFIVYADTAPNTLFILDNYPEVFPYQPFHGAYWFITNPIPRAFFPGKPEALGAVLRDQMGVAPNLGPGVIGHGWTEGGWFGVVGYALFFGLLVGVVDRALADRAHNPYFVSIAGSGLGNVIALPRGDTPLFLLQILGGIAVTLVALYLLRITVGPVVRAFPSIEVAPTPGKWGLAQSAEWDDADDQAAPEADAPDDRLLDENAEVPATHRAN